MRSVITRAAGHQSVGSLCTLCTNTFSILTNTFVQNTVFWADCKRSQRRPKVYQRNWWQNLVLCVWSRRKLCITLNCERPTDDGCLAPGCGGTLRSPHRWKLGASQKIRLARFWRKTGRAQKFGASQCRWIVDHPHHIVDIRKENRKTGFEEFMQQMAAY